MLRRLGTAVADLKDHAVAARELSIGVYSALVFLLGSKSDV